MKGANKNQKSGHKKRRNEEDGQQENGNKRVKGQEDKQGIKRKKEEVDGEAEEIRRMIEDEVEKVNSPGWIRGEPNKAGQICEVEISQVISLVDKWVQGVKDQGFEEMSFKGNWEAWDDVKGGRLTCKLVKEARQ